MSMSMSMSMSMPMWHAAPPSVRLRRASHLRVCSFRPRSATAKMAVVKTWRGAHEECGRGVWAGGGEGCGDPGTLRPVVRVWQRALGCKGVRATPRLRV